jgi:hypothetical protein
MITQCGKQFGISLAVQEIEDAAEQSSSLKVMVMLEDAPDDFITQLSPQYTLWSARGAVSSEHSCRPTLSSSGPRSSHTALCLLCCNLSSPRCDHAGGYVDGQAVRARARTMSTLSESDRS